MAKSMTVLAIVAALAAAAPAAGSAEGAYMHRAQDRRDVEGGVYTLWVETRDGRRTLYMVKGPNGLVAIRMGDGGPHLLYGDAAEAVDAALATSARHAEQALVVHAAPETLLVRQDAPAYPSSGAADQGARPPGSAYPHAEARGADAKIVFEPDDDARADFKAFLRAEDIAARRTAMEAASQAGVTTFRRDGVETVRIAGANARDVTVLLDDAGVSDPGARAAIWAEIGR